MFSFYERTTACPATPEPRFVRQGQNSIRAISKIHRHINSLLKKPSAWIPIALSLTVLAAMLITIALSGLPVREADEGTGAHLFQIWLVLEVLMVAFFASKCLPQAPKQALVVLAIQIIAALLPMSIVFFLNL